MTATRDLVAMLATVARLSEYGSHDDAYQLLGAIDRVAIGLELYNESMYQFASHKCLQYIEYCYNNDIDFHNTIMWAIHWAEVGECEKAWETLNRLTRLTTHPGKLDLLHQAVRDVKCYCHHSLDRIEGH